MAASFHAAAPSTPHSRRVRRLRYRPLPLGEAGYRSSFAWRQSRRRKRRSRLKRAILADPGGRSRAGLTHESFVPAARPRACMSPRLLDTDPTTKFDCLRRLGATWLSNEPVGRGVFQLALESGVRDGAAKTVCAMGCAGMCTRPPDGRLAGGFRLVVRDPQWMRRP